MTWTTYFSHMVEIFQSHGKMLLQKSFSLKNKEISEKRFLSNEKVSDSSSFIFLDKKKIVNTTVPYREAGHLNSSP